MVRTKDARRREDLVSRGVMLGRPLLGWLLHGKATHHVRHICAWWLQTLPLQTKAAKRTFWEIPTWTGAVNTILWLGA